MPEAIIQYAVNSTLGTENFKALDKLLIDFIEGNKAFVGSDATIGTFPSANFSAGASGGGRKTIGFFTPKYNGALRLYATISKSRNQYGGTAGVSIYEYTDSGNVHKGGVSTSSTTPETKSSDFSITKGNKYYVSFSAGSDGGSASNIRLCGTLQDINNAIEFEVIN